MSKRRIVSKHFKIQELYQEIPCPLLVNFSAFDGCLGRLHGPIQDAIFFRFGLAVAYRFYQAFQFIPHTVLETRRHVRSANRDGERDARGTSLLNEGKRDTVEIRNIKKSRMSQQARQTERPKMHAAMYNGDIKWI